MRKLVPVMIISALVLAPSNSKVFAGESPAISGGAMSSSETPDEMPPWKFGLNTQAVSVGFDLTPRVNGSTEVLNYRPAQSNYLGVILGYRWLAGTVSFAVPASSDIRSVEGTSDYHDYRLSYYARHFGVEVGYNQYKGYLIDNSAALPAGSLAAGQTYFKLPDLETIGYGLTGLYVFDDSKFSMPAALAQSAIQHESGGSWLLIGAWRWQSLSSVSPIIPASEQGAFGQDATLNYARTVSYAAGGGYAYNWVPSTFYLSGLIAVSLGYQATHYDLTGPEADLSSVGINAHVRLSLGWNVPRWFITVTAAADSFMAQTASIQINETNASVVLAGGIRLGEESPPVPTPPAQPASP